MIKNFSGLLVPTSTQPLVVGGTVVGAVQLWHPETGGQLHYLKVGALETRVNKVKKARLDSLELKEAVVCVDYLEDQEIQGLRANKALQEIKV